MALSGTLETFSLPDVLRLLSSTKKTGHLALDGDRGTGSVWVEDGDIVAARADRSVVDDVGAVLFELLRFVDAAFEFEAGVPADDPGPARAVDDALATAQARLEEWRDIEAVVPSLDVHVRMVPDLDDTVEVDPPMWRLLARVGTGASGHDVARHLAQGEFEVCRSLRNLVEAGMVELTEAEAEVGADEREVAPDPPASHEPLAIADAFDAMVHAPVPEPETAIEAPDAHEVPDGEPTSSPADELAAIFAPASPPESGLEAAEAAEPDVDLLSDLAHLSPKAAAAVEATWGADAEPGDAVGDGLDEQPEPAAEAPSKDGEDLDQNLLLRFLSSAKH